MADKPTEKMTKEEMLIDIEIKLKQALLDNALEDQKDRVAARQDAEEQRQQRANIRAKRIATQRSNAEELASVARRLKARIEECPHRKGGVDLAGWFRGTKDQFSVCTWVAPNQDAVLWCSRCKNFVLPPIEPVRIDLEAMPINLDRYGIKTPAELGFFSKGPEGSKAFAEAMKIYRVGMATYKRWLQMPTDNIPSTACFPGQTGGDLDWKRLYRKAIHDTHEIPIFQAERWPMGEDKQDAA